MSYPLYLKSYRFEVIDLNRNVIKVHGKLASNLITPLTVSLQSSDLYSLCYQALLDLQMDLHFSFESQPMKG